MNASRRAPQNQPRARMPGELRFPTARQGSTRCSGGRESRVKAAESFSVSSNQGAASLSPVQWE
ncbi:hypothetical protein EYF80_052086 [Liparis tanakae]|uniref:Uncharacterized protein n=1 Tax=Liparis tanakae TaxID=230148 RepID=A0A4Z2F9A5_9TELE|nr:hypothetical protein EYF80_052086 [Liparis tanakae]